LNRLYIFASGPYSRTARITNPHLASFFLSISALMPLAKAAILMRNFTGC